MRLLLVAFVAVGLSGCGRTPPTVAGGKPVSDWVNTLQSPDVKLRKKAASKLGNVGPTDPVAFPALMRALRDTDAGVRCEVILALTKFGSGAKEAIPDLTVIHRQDPNAQVRTYAARALEQIRGDQ